MTNTMSMLKRTTRVIYIGCGWISGAALFTFGTVPAVAAAYHFWAMDWVRFVASLGMVICSALTAIIVWALAWESQA